MKKLLIIAVLMITSNLSAQSRFNFIDYYKPSVKILIQGNIEIDGHEFDNGKSKDPIKFEADLDGIKIYDSKNQYQKRKCDVEKCKVIHLEAKNIIGTSIISGWNGGKTTLEYNLPSW